MQIFLMLIIIAFSTSCSNPSPPVPPTPAPTATAGPIMMELDPTPRFGMLAPPDLSGKLSQKSERAQKLTPKIVDSLYPSGRYFNLIAMNEDAIASACVRGVDVFDISKSGNLLRTKSFDTPGHAWSVLKLDNRLWVADDYAGVTILDSDTGEVVLQWKDLDNARSFCRVDSRKVLVCRHSHGATLVDAFDEANPKILTEMKVNGRIFCATAYQSDLYIGSLECGYQAFRLSDHSEPRSLWTFSGPERILWCDRRGAYHYLIDQDYGLWILKDQEESMPVRAGKLELSGQSRDAAFFDDEKLLIARREGMAIVDISNPEQPRLLDNIKPGNEGRGVLVTNGRIFMSDGDLGIKEYLLSDKSTFKVTAQFDNEKLLTDIAMKNSTAFSTHSRGGLEITQIKDDKKIKHLNTISGFDYAVNLALAGNTLAIVDYDGLKLLDVANPDSPKFLGKFTSPGRATGVCISDKTALVADWFEGVHLVDITDPQDPRLLSTIKTTGWATDVETANGYAYICAVNGGLITADISNRRQPNETATDVTIGAPEGLAISNKHLYAADFNAGLVIFDLENPAAPKPLSYYSLNVCKGVAIRDDLLLVSNYIYGVKFFDIADPINPILIGEVDTPGKAYETCFIPGRNAAFVADWHALLVIEW